MFGRTDSWWGLGEGSGFDSNELAIYRIECPFCSEEGNFTTVFHAEKKKPKESKVLNFDTLQCGSCNSYVMVLWSASEWGGRGLHDFRVLPWPLRYTKFPESWPKRVGELWLQAKRSLKDENWDTAAVMARSSLQAALRDRQAQGKNLREEINDLAGKGILPPIMKEWSDHVRELGNESAHPKPEEQSANRQEATDIVRFLDFLLQYLYDLPHSIQEYRKRREAESAK